MEIGIETLIAALVGALAGAPIIASAFDRRREQVSSTWRELAEGRAAQVDELTTKVAHLEAKVDLLASNFVSQMAHEVASAVMETMEAMEHKHTDPR
jgi:outer membrane murein-binding lipoprotein Lpp